MVEIAGKWETAIGCRRKMVECSSSPFGLVTDHQKTQPPIRDVRRRCAGEQKKIAEYIRWNRLE